LEANRFVRVEGAGQTGLFVLFLFLDVLMDMGGSRGRSGAARDDARARDADLKARVGANDEDMQNIPELIRTEFRLTNSQIARLSRDVAELQRGLGDLSGKVDVMPRVVAGLVVELLADRDKKR
jgi:hypothetical protein